jgi:acyl-CoA thioester hydrolase
VLDEHELTLRVRYSETDAQGFVHHSHYLSYFEMGRTELFRAGGGNYRAMEDRGLFFVVAQLTCRYHKPARYDDMLTLRTRVAKLSQARLEHEYRLYRGDELLTTGHSVLACVDREGNIKRIPEVLESLKRPEQ